MTMSFVDIKNRHNLQDIIFNNIERRKPRLEVTLKATWQGAVFSNGCKKLVERVSFLIYFLY